MDDLEIVFYVLPQGLRTIDGTAAGKCTKELLAANALKRYELPGLALEKMMVAGCAGHRDVEAAGIQAFRQRQRPGYMRERHRFGKK